jgi:glycosyltransferase involved in cell wall biosynthesis
VAPGIRWRLEETIADSLPFEDLAARISAEAMIALGYPDQFPFLHNPGLPSYLWSQFSRPPRRPLPEPPTYVPLTLKTATHLSRGGCSRIGPVIPHGVDCRLFAPLPRHERDGDLLVIGTVAENSRRKRLDLILRSFALFSRDRPASRLLIKTNRPVSLDGVDLSALIAAEHLADRVEIVLGELGDSQMAELYNRMDLYLNLSEWEGFCIPVIEAMACAVPVVCPPIQGPGEILPYPDMRVPGGQIHEEDGALLYQADPGSVAGRLSALAEDAELRGRLSREGRAAALCRYDLHRVAALWDQLIQDR